MKRAVQFGAGNIGRGFIGELFSQAGMEVVFVDVVPEVLEGLNTRRQYTITVAGEPVTEVLVTNVRAVNGMDLEAVAAEVADCEVACTAVGVNVLPTVARPIAEGIKQRRSSRPDDTLNIIVCENMRDAAGALRDLVAEKLEGEDLAWMQGHIGFAQAVVGRMVPVRTEEERLADPVGIRVEPFKKLPVDADALKGELPEIAGVFPKANFQAYIDQKLFAHNCGHASAAYFGALAGKTYLWECMDDPELKKMTRRVMQETGEALIARYGLNPEEHWEHVEDLLFRFSNRRLGDTVARVGADPVRKLRPDDRLTGAALFCLEQGIRPVYLSQAIAAALRFDNPEDPASVQVQTLIREKGVPGAFEELTGQPAGSELAVMVLAAYENLSNCALVE